MADETPLFSEAAVTAAGRVLRHLTANRYEAEGAAADVLNLPEVRREVQQVATAAYAKGGADGFTDDHEVCEAERDRLAAALAVAERAALDRAEQALRQKADPRWFSSAVAATYDAAADLVASLRDESP